MLLSSPTEIVLDDIFLEIRDIIPQASFYLKLEGISITGSIKVKAALHMVGMLEASKLLKPGGKLIESSSGNLGLALSMICATRGYEFICISDPNISQLTASLIEAYGAKLIIINKQDKNGGYLGSRIELIRNMLAADKDLIWVNQYENVNNVDAHYWTTGASIISQFSKPDFVFIGAGTTGTLGGVSRYIRKHSPSTKIIAVDSVGSVTFGMKAAKRHIPGLGTSSPPKIRGISQFDDLLMIKEEETIKMCHYIARKGLLLGGSSGTVLCGVAQYSPNIKPNQLVVAISPDMGDRYVNTLYHTKWVEERFPNIKNDSIDINDIKETWIGEKALSKKSKVNA